MTICDGTNPIVATTFAVLGGVFRLRLREAFGTAREADVLDDDGNIIGYASDYPYKGTAWSVHTRPFAGYVPFEQVEMV